MNKKYVYIGVALVFFLGIVFLLFAKTAYAPENGRSGMRGGDTSGVDTVSVSATTQTPSTTVPTSIHSQVNIGNGSPQSPQKPVTSPTVTPTAPATAPKVPLPPVVPTSSVPKQGTTSSSGPSSGGNTSSGQCVRAGCSAQYCVDEKEAPNIVTTCEWTEKYACYAQAVCERQSSGQCGWTDTEESRQCMQTAQ